MPSPRWLSVTGGPLRGGQLLLMPGAAPWQEEMREGRFEAFLHDALDSHMRKAMQVPMRETVQLV